MIGYRVSRADLETQIGAKWLANARARTDLFRQLGHYAEQSPAWSAVKKVYMALQHQKCAYCERKLESSDYGAGEQDIEHFRPKSSVKAWKVPGELTRAGIGFSPIPAGPTGYYLLPYHPLNYSAACKPCNSVLKKDYFPIAGAYDFRGDDPAAMGSEQPYLIYPIGDVDERPEDLLRFNGIAPCPVETAPGHRRNRALVTIAFFELDSQKRKNLLRERASCLIALYPHLHTLADPQAAPSRHDGARRVIDAYTDPSAPHTNCSRSFVRLFHDDQAQAAAFYDAAVRLVSGSS